MTTSVQHYLTPLGVAVYDAMYQGSLNGDGAFYVGCAQEAGGPVLEFGAGTGRISRILAAAGCEVTAVDLSPQMLAAARVNAADDAARGRITWLEGDMRSLDLGRTFGSVIVPARSFMHLLTPDAQRRALEVFRTHLAPGGRLVLDLFDPDLEMLVAPLQPEKELLHAKHPLTEARYRRTVTDRTIDPEHQIIHETITVEELGPEDQVLAAEDASWRLRWSVRQEIAYLLELTGFRAVAEYGDFDRGPPGYAREQLWLAEAV
ncbi:MAG: class I SAM-dependent methyltransferase [Pseudomonadota bacterium]